MRAYDWAKEEYFKGAQQKALAEGTGFPLWRIRGWIYGTKEEGGWLDEKRQIEARVKEEVFRDEKERYGQILENVMSALEKGAEKINKDIQEGERTLEVQDIKRLVDATEQLKSITEEAIPIGKINLNLKIGVETVMKKLMESDPMSYPGEAIDITPSEDEEEDDEY